MQWLPVYLVMKKEFPMKALVDLFSTDYGLLSVAVLAITVGMMGFFYRMFTRKMNEAEAANRK